MESASAATATDGGVGAWAACGAMWLTGHPGLPPIAPRASVLDALRPVTDRLACATASWGVPVYADPAGMLTVRAAVSGLTRRGRLSAGGSCRLLATADDGWLAINLARDVDREAVEAVVGERVEDDPWTVLGRAAGRSGAAQLLARAQLLEVPAAALPRTLAREVPPWWRELAVGRRAHPQSAPLVVDLSSMWAGPLCAALLGHAGARVVKVEDADRPDGARAGSRAFFDLLHDGHESVVLDFRDRAGGRALRRLLYAADVVVDSSRPRAMAQLGIEPEALVRWKPGKTWVSLTAYGRRGPGAERVGFGDDVAVAAGLVAWDGTRRPVFCADAIADPLGGIVAAAAAASALADGGGRVIEVALSDVASRVAQGPPLPRHRVGARGGDWWAEAGDRTLVAAPRPTAAPRRGGARPSGADTVTVLAELSDW